MHLEEKKITLTLTIPHLLDECGMVNKRLFFLPFSRSMKTTHYSVQTVSAQSAQLAVHMRKLDRHLGLKGTETPLGQTSLAHFLICRMIGRH